MQSTADDKLMILKLKVRELVNKWTEKAQSAALTDDERLAYYSCAEELHNIDGN
jgi:hypothetical protein